MKHIITTVFVFVSYILSAQVKISDLPAAGTVAGTEVFPIVQSAATKKLPIDSVRFWKQNGSGEIYRISDVGIGTTTPDFNLDVAGDTSALRVISDNTTLEISNNVLGIGISGAGVSYMHDASKNFSVILGDIGGEPAAQMTYNNDTSDIGVVISMESASMIATDSTGNPYSIVEARYPEGVQIAGVDSGSVNNSLTVRKGNATFLAGSVSFAVRNDGQVTISDLAGSAEKVVTALADGTLDTASILWELGSGDNSLQDTRGAVASGDYSIAIGIADTASGTLSTVSGGENNKATGLYSTVSGGSGNVASGESSNVSGGGGNSATAAFAIVCGGTGNVASNTASICLSGQQNVASGEFAIAAGEYNTASGNYSVATGGSANSATGRLSTITGGAHAIANQYGQESHSGQFFADSSLSQRTDFTLLVTTNDANPTVLTLDLSVARLVIDTNTTLSAIVNIAGVTTDGSQAAHYIRKVAIKNVAGTTSLIGSVSVIGTDAEDDAAWDVAITANNTDNSLDITVTGAAATVINWSAHVEGVNMGF